MHVDLSPEHTLTRRHCASCRQPLVGAYCAHCGQREFTGRHTLRTMLFSALGRLLNLERGFLHTAFRLTVAPGRTVREYLRGRLAPYTHPVAYLVISFAAFALSFTASGGIGGENGGNRMFTALAVPCIAAVSWLVFRRARLNYTEHLILVMYLVGHIALFLALVLPVATIAGEPADLALSLTALGLSVGYFGWAYSRFFDLRPVLAAAGAVATLLGGIAIWLAGLVAVLNALRAAGWI